MFYQKSVKDRIVNCKSKLYQTNFYFDTVCFLNATADSCHPDATGNPKLRVAVRTNSMVTFTTNSAI